MTEILLRSFGLADRYALKNSQNGLWMQGRLCVTGQAGKAT